MLGDEGHEVPCCVKGPLLACTLAIWWPEEKGTASSRQRMLWGLALALELAKGYSYAAWLPALLAFWWYRDRLRWVPGMWMLLVLSATMSLVLWRVAAKLGYVSDRHTLLLVLCGMYWAVAGLFFFGYRLMETARRLLTGSSPVNSKPTGAGVKPASTLGIFMELAQELATIGAGVKPASILGVALLIAVFARGFWKTLEPLHRTHDGYRVIGEWLHAHVQAADIIEDPHKLASFYAGRELVDRPAPPPPGYQPTRYVVYSTGNERLRLTHNDINPPTVGTVVRHWQSPHAKDRYDILVYEILPKQ